MNKVSWWLKAWSYVAEVQIESASSVFNPTLQVSLYRGRYQLSTERSIYSFDDLYVNYLQAFKKVTLPPNGGEVLLLGVGLGSVPFMLEHIFKKKYSYVAVEIDDVVIYLASKYTLSRLSAPIETICADATAFVQQDSRKFDLIIVDLFLDDVIPESFEHSDMNEQVRDKLKPGGLVMYNRLYRTYGDRQRTEKFYHEVFEATYDQSSYINVKGNWILLGSSGNEKPQHPF
ncbi:MAG: class I SAM-dependent methyltransferase [Saprospiraceae bacterium]|nr:class I SAM-dependent methyltransferase [Saprospiraceae bacterium]